MYFYFAWGGVFRGYAFVNLPHIKKEAHKHKSPENPKSIFIHNYFYQKFLNRLKYIFSLLTKILINKNIIHVSIVFPFCRDMCITPSPKPKNSLIFISIAFSGFGLHICSQSLHNYLHYHYALILNMSSFQNHLFVSKSQHSSLVLHFGLLNMKQQAPR